MAVIAAGRSLEAIIIAIPRPLARHRELRGGNKGDGRDVSAEIVVLGIGEWCRRFDRCALDIAAPA